MNLQLFTKWYAKYVLLALCCVVLLVVPLLKGPWIGSEPFLFSRIAELQAWYDPLSFGGRFAAYEWGTPLVLGFAPGILVQILPFILGVLSFLLLHMILAHFRQDLVFVHISLLLLTLSPSFIYTFSFMNGLCIATFLSLAAFYFFIQKKWKWLSIPIVMILPLFNIMLTIVFLAVLFLYAFFWKKDKRKWFLILLLASSAAAGIYYGYIFYNTGLPQSLPLEEGARFAVFQRIFFDLGSPFGLGIFISLLAAFGIISTWERKYENLFLFFATSFLFLFSLFRPEGLIFLNILFVLFAAKGLMRLAEIQWTNTQYQFFIILVIISGLVFSSISQMDRLTEALPDEAMLHGLDFLAAQEPGVVFSDYSRGVWINYAGHKNVLDENYEFVPEAAERAEDSQELFYSRDLQNTSALFTKYHVNYVWIDEDMRQNIWTYDTEGLLFILEYTKSFNKIYDKDGVEIWKIEQ